MSEKRRRPTARAVLEAAGPPPLERNLLKDNTAELLRDFIVSGRVEPGAKLAEREMSEALGVSRMPVRDAMIVLEQQGLVVARANGRYVVDLTADEARQLTEVRSALEFLAVELAVKALAHDEAASLTGPLARMQAACRVRATQDFIDSDLDIHRAIWRAARNVYLEKTLTTILGPLQVAIASAADAFDWLETLDIHETLVAALVRRDRDAALAAMHWHMASITR